MSEEPMAKKSRVWNPAIEEDTPTEGQQKDSVKSVPQPFDQFNINSPFHNEKRHHNPILPNIIQNYFHLAPLFAQFQHQQRQMEHLMLRPMATMVSPPVPLPSQPVNRPPETHNKNASFSNPLVASIVGGSAVNENSCATCGATFRLTGDLVQHMRNNHRRSRFKRKNDKSTL